MTFFQPSNPNGPGDVYENPACPSEFVFFVIQPPYQTDWRKPSVSKSTTLAVFENLITPF